MDNRDLSGIGEQIRKSVETALGSMDFEELNKNISDSVGGALDEARKSLQNVVGQTGTWQNQKYEPDGGKATAKASDGSRTRGNTSDGSRSMGTVPNVNQGKLNWEKANERGGRPIARIQTGLKDPVSIPGVRVNYPSRVAGILYTVFGSIGIGVSAILLLVVLFVSVVTRPFLGALTGGIVFLLILGGVFSIMLGVGRSMLGKIKRLKCYLKEAGNKTYCSLENLSGSVGKSQKFVIKDIGRMISRGILPEVRWDAKKTCLMLNQEAYRQYQEASKAFETRKQLEEDQMKAAAKQKAADGKLTGESAGDEHMTEELRQMVASGKNYVRILREANEAIPGEEISAKLTRLETIISRIFESVERHREQAGGMERFMEYYLPTTVKLVNAYRDFDSVDTAGGNVASAKQEIENTLDTINQAFERLLDDLYSDAALDASTDASALQSMLKQDGFAGSDFK